MCIVRQLSSAMVLYLAAQFSSVPPDYDALHTRLTRHGSRVLALGYRQLGTLSMREVRACVCVGHSIAYFCRSAF